MSDSMVLRKPGAQRVRFVPMSSAVAEEGEPSRGIPGSPARRHVVGGRPQAEGWVPLQGTIAQADAAQLEEEYRRGLEDGRKAMSEEVQKRLEEADRDVQRRMTALLSNVQAQFQSLLGRIETDAMRFAVAVAERIVRREVSLDDEVVIRQIQDAVRRVVGTDTIKLRIHPDDEVVVREHRAALLSLSHSIRDAIIETDASIEPGGCIIESPAGNVDARLTTQLRQIESALFSAQSQNDGGNG